jgi:hypothetical protein
MLNRQTRNLVYPTSFHVSDVVPQLRDGLRQGLVAEIPLPWARGAEIADLARTGRYAHI